MAMFGANLNCACNAQCSACTWEANYYNLHPAVVRQETAVLAYAKRIGRECVVKIDGKEATLTIGNFQVVAHQIALAHQNIRNVLMGVAYRRLLAAGKI